MNLTEAQLRAMDNVLSIFETGRVVAPSAYATCTILDDGAGISYGKHQATDRANSLDRIVGHYISLKGTYAEELRPFLGYLQTNGSAKENRKAPSEVAQALIALLKKAGFDPVMQQAQDDVFALDYRKPALDQAGAIGLTRALSALAFYDTCIQSGPGGIGVIRSLFPEVPPSKGGDERAFIRAYLAERREWLASRSNPLVRASVYRADALLALAVQDNWDLATPFKCRGVTVA